MEKLKVGIIGCGAQGRSHFAAYNRMLDIVDIVAVCDIKEETLVAAGQRWPEAKTFSNYRDLLDSADFNLISVNTMPNTHRDITVAALEKGAHVLCEKPFARSVAEGDEMLGAAEKRGLMIQVGTNMRYMLEAKILKELIDSGKLGMPTYIHAWTYYTDLPWWGSHHIKELAVGGALASTAIHITDVGLWVVGSPDPITVSGSTHRMFPNKRFETAPSAYARDQYDVEDIAAAHIRLSNGGTMMLEGTWAHERRDSHYSFEIICEKGTICLNPLSILMDEGGEIVDRTPADYATEEERGNWGDSIYREIFQFVTAIREGTQPSQTHREIRNLQLIQDSIYESAATGREVLLDQ